MSKGNLYIDCTSGVSGDMLCKCLTDLCDEDSFVEEQQQLINDELHHEEQHQNGHGHEHADADEHPHTHQDDHADEHRHTHQDEDDQAHDHAHPHSYTNRSFQSILALLADCQLNDDVKAMTLKIYTILAAAEAQVHGKTLETVHFHEVGRPQAIINMVGIAAALSAIKPSQVYCSKIIDGIGTVQCAHGEISVPVPAVRALMSTSTLLFGNQEVEMEMVTPTGLAALLAMEPHYMATRPELEHILKTADARGERQKPDLGLHRGLKITLFRG